ncbi:MAG: sigma-70 family RNA polymerase sigma factor [Planctomycetes bacterium]|nr:sigma-70 family RNA polymerase sigma factor [Planctomycetota bacterium]
MDIHATDPESLLSDLPRLRRLAVALLGDEHAADDVTQDAWLAARRADPPDDPSARARWMARVVRRLASNRRRGERRRDARERAVARGESSDATSPEIVARREELRRHVVEAVLALPEPQREVLLLRFWDGLAPRQIARRLGIPDATVRTRSMRGLERVRERLDTRTGGRERWVAALAPAVGLRPVAVAARAALLAPLIGVAATLVAVLLVLDPWTSDGAPTLDASLARAEPTHALPAPGAPRASDVTPLALPEAQPAAPPPSTDGRIVYPAQRASSTLHGLVLDPDGRPVPGARVEARPDVGPLPRRYELDDDRAAPPGTSSDEAGRFAFAALPDGAWTFTAAAGALSGSTRTLAGATEPVVVELAEPAALPQFTVRVVDPSDAPVADALVLVFGWDGGDGAPGLDDAPPWSARTNAQGVTRTPFSLRTGGSLLVVAHTDDGRVGQAKPAHDGFGAPTGSRVVVDRPGNLAGRFVPSGALGEGTFRLRVHARSSHAPYGSAAGFALDATVDGLTFALDGLPAGTYSLELDDERGLRLERPPYLWGTQATSAPGPVTCEIAAGRTTTLELPVVAGASIAGRVLDAAGAPIEGARVLVLPVPDNVNLEEGQRIEGTAVWRASTSPLRDLGHPDLWRRALTDADGRYLVAGLSPAAYRVEVEADGLCFDRRDDLVLRDAERLELEHVLEPDGVLQLGLPDDYLGSIGARAPGAGHPAVVASVRAPVTTWPRLRPGHYELVQYVGFERRPEPLTEVDVVAGRTVFVDLRPELTRGALYTGRIELPGVELAGANAQLLGHAARLDADGRFLIVLPSPAMVVLGAPHFTVRKGRCRWATPLTDDLRGVERWDGVFALGRETLEVDAPPGSRIDLILNDGLAPDGRHASFDGALDVGPTGIARFAALPAGEATLWTTLPDGPRVEQHTPVPAPGPVRVDVPYSGRIKVRVFRPDGTPAVGARVWVTTARPDGDDAGPTSEDEHAAAARGASAPHPLSVASGSTDVLGIVQFAGIAAGRITVRADDRLPSAQSELELAPDEERFVVLHLRDPVRDAGRTGARTRRSPWEVR